MTRNAMERPQLAEEERLADVGLIPCAESRMPMALRWTVPDGSGGILFASHLPIPWGAYWRSERDRVEMVWSRDLESVLLALFHARQGAQILRLLSEVGVDPPSN